MNIKAINIKAEISRTEIIVALLRYEMEELLFNYYRNKENWYEISVNLDNCLKQLEIEKERLKKLKEDFVMKFNG